MVLFILKDSTVHRVKMDTVTTVEIMTFDPDGDTVVCSQSASRIPAAAHTVVNKDCTVTIHPDAQSGFLDGNLYMAEVLLEDYNARPLQLEGDVTVYSPGALRLGQANIQFAFFVEGNQTVPAIIPPTWADNSEIWIYAGASFRTRIFAAPFDANARPLVAVDVTTLPEVNLTTGHLTGHPARSMDGVRVLDIHWVSSQSDVGTCMVRVKARDSAGFSSAVLKYKVMVKEMPAFSSTQRMVSSNFLDLPENASVTCPPNTFCMFALRVHRYWSLLSVAHVEVQCMSVNILNTVTASIAATNQTASTATMSMLPPVSDPCVNSGCKQGSTCQATSPTTFVCRCKPFITGTYCETAIDPCTQQVCKNGATCVSDVVSFPGFFACQCIKGFQGQQCEINIDDCAPSPCINSGTCVDHVDGFSCLCPPYFTGSSCQTRDLNFTITNIIFLFGIYALHFNPITTTTFGTTTTWTGTTPTTPPVSDPCVNSGCKQGSTCQATSPTTFVCRCKPFITGTYCETAIDPCTQQVCKNGATCVSDVVSFPGFFACQCIKGFQGQQCEINIDDCATSPCANSGTCVDQVDGYSCVCPPNYTGSSCQTPIDPCTQPVCKNGATCVSDVVSFPGFFACQCIKGFQGQQCEIIIGGNRYHGSYILQRSLSLVIGANRYHNHHSSHISNNYNHHSSHISNNYNHHSSHISNNYNHHSSHISNNYNHHSSHISNNYNHHSSHISNNFNHPSNNSNHRPKHPFDNKNDHYNNYNHHYSHTPNNFKHHFNNYIHQSSIYNHLSKNNNHHSNELSNNYNYLFNHSNYLPNNFNHHSNNPTNFHSNNPTKYNNNLTDFYHNNLTDFYNNPTKNNYENHRDFYYDRPTKYSYNNPTKYSYNNPTDFYYNNPTDVYYNNPTDVYYNNPTD
ncbi:hypothetical protein EGW08_012455, partial [Elysia chlorotica]